jgi:hypothetical protein
VTDYGKLIERVRDDHTCTDALHSDLADAVEALVADVAEDRRALNDAIDVANRNKIDAEALRTQLDSMTEEWGVRVSVPSQWWIETMRDRGECERWIDNPPLRYTHQVGEAFSIVKRLAAGPWVEVEGDKSNE